MARGQVDHSDIVRLAQDGVCLRRDKDGEYRAQARRLRENLDGCAGGAYPPKRIIPTLGGILTFESDWSPAIGKTVPECSRRRPG